MTPLQLKAFDFIRDTIGSTGVAPTYDEIAAHMGTTKGRAHPLVTSLVEQGLLARALNRSRGLQLVNVPDARSLDTQVLRAELARRGFSLDSLVEPREKPRPGPLAQGTASCAGTFCRDKVEVGRLFCRPHWYTVPVDIREGLLTLHRAAVAGNAEAEGDFLALFNEARDIVDASMRRKG